MITSIYLFVLSFVLLSVFNPAIAVCSASGLTSRIVLQQLLAARWAVELIYCIALSTLKLIGLFFGSIIITAVLVVASMLISLCFSGCYSPGGVDAGQNIRCKTYTTIHCNERSKQLEITDTVVATGANMYGEQLEGFGADGMSLNEACNEILLGRHFTFGGYLDEELVYKRKRKQGLHSRIIPLSTLNRIGLDYRQGLVLQGDTEVALLAPVSMIGQTYPPVSKREDLIRNGEERILIYVPPDDDLPNEVRFQVISPIARETPLAVVAKVAVWPILSWLSLTFFLVFGDIFKLEFIDRPARKIADYLKGTARSNSKHLGTAATTKLWIPPDAARKMDEVEAKIQKDRKYIIATFGLSVPVSLLLASLAVTVVPLPGGHAGGAVFGLATGIAVAISIVTRTKGNKVSIESGETP